MKNALIVMSFVLSVILAPLAPDLQKSRFLNI